MDTIQLGEMVPATPEEIARYTSIVQHERLPSLDAESRTDTIAMLPELHRVSRVRSGRVDNEERKTSIWNVGCRMLKEVKARICGLGKVVLV